MSVPRTAFHDPLRLHQRIDAAVHHVRAQWTFNKLRGLFRPNERLLNLGAGDCLLSARLREEFHCDVVNVDIQDSSLAPTERVRLYDGSRLPYADRTFDSILLLHVLHHCRDQEAVAREVRRVCRGRVVVVEDANCSPVGLAILRGFHRYLEKVEDMPAADCFFRTPQGWKEFFRRSGLSVRQMLRWRFYLSVLPPGNVVFELTPVAV